MAADGAPAGGMYATDLFGGFWELGFELFRDGKRMREVRFAAGSVFEGVVEGLLGERGVDVVFAGSFLHLFDWEGQKGVLRRVVGVCGVGGWVVGCQIGSTRGREVKTGLEGRGSFFIMCGLLRGCGGKWRRRRGVSGRLRLRKGGWGSGGWRRRIGSGWVRMLLGWVLGSLGRSRAGI